MSRFVPKLPPIFGLALFLLLADPQSSCGAVQDAESSEISMRDLIENFRADRGSLRRTYNVPMSAAGDARFREFHEHWLALLKQVTFDSLDQDRKVDYLLFQNHLQASLRRQEYQQGRDDEARSLIPFADPLIEILDRRQRKESIDPRAAAELLAEINQSITQTLADSFPEGSPLVANRAADRVDGLRRSIADWHSYYDGYDPEFSWWTKNPYAELDGLLKQYSTRLREELAGVAEGDEDTIIGDPIGRDALLDELAFEMIPYSPEELVEIANQEFAWCEAQMLQASEELGFESQWRDALEHVKGLHVEPGKQPAMIKGLAEEAIEFLEARDLLTIPPLCKETWRMQMMSPERQRTSPYFLGGETIIISYPTDEMTHQEKLMSMRGNNIHFARATVHHELIPGHHLQGFMLDRHRTYRSLFRTPFWTEGWALYWEMRLWELGFPRTAEDRVGMLFWRMHRCARIIFSLSFHLGTMTPDEAVTFLTERVGHEERNARAEVRRSVAGNYGPLYQAAYMLGGLQIRALHRDLVESGTMTDREFHDAILRQNSIPIAMLRAALTDQELAPDHQVDWRFYSD